MKNTSGMILFQVGDAAKGAEIVHQLIERLQTIPYAVSLEHHRSLIFWMETAPLMETSFKHEGAQLESYRAFAGDGVFRLSVGLFGPVAFSCRLCCSFKPPSVRKRPGFSNPMLSGVGADCRTRLCIRRLPFQRVAVFPMAVARSVQL